MSKGQLQLPIDFYTWVNRLCSDVIFDIFFAQTNKTLYFSVDDYQQKYTASIIVCKVILMLIE